MKYTIDNPSKTTAKVTVTVDEKDLAPIKQEALKRLSKQVKIPGFRPGKTPVEVAEKHLDPNALQSEVLEGAVNQYYIQAAIEAKLQPLGRPQVNVAKFVPFTELEFTAESEIVPAIKLADYKKMKKSAPKADVKAEDVKNVLENLRAQTATKEDVDRAAKDGDEVVIDFAGKDEKGEAIQGAAGTDYSLGLGSKTFIDGFEENLVGLKAGDKKEFTLTFPKDYGHAPLANKKVTFDVTVKKVKEVKKAKLDDEFAKNVAQLDTIAQLKADIKKELEAQQVQNLSQNLKNEIIEEIVEKSEIPLPEILINDQIEGVKQDYLQNLAYRGQTLPDHLKEKKMTEEEFDKKEILPIAEKRVQTGLVLAEIARIEGIEATAEDLRQETEDMKKRIQDPKMLEQLMSDAAQRDMASRIQTRKTLEYLADTITTKK